MVEQEVFSPWAPKNSSFYAFRLYGKGHAERMRLILGNLSGRLPEESVAVNREGWLVDTLGRLFIYPILNPLPGEPWSVSLISFKGECLVSSSFVPNPIRSSKGEVYAVELLLTHKDLLHFSVVGSGFLPGESIELSFRSEPWAFEKKMIADQRGMFKADLDFTSFCSTPSCGRLSLRASRGLMTLDLPWGIEYILNYYVN